MKARPLAVDGRGEEILRGGIADVELEREFETDEFDERGTLATGFGGGREVFHFLANDGDGALGRDAVDGGDLVAAEAGGVAVGTLLVGLADEQVAIAFEDGETVSGAVVFPHQGLDPGCYIRRF